LIFIDLLILNSNNSQQCKEIEIIMDKIIKIPPRVIKFTFSMKKRFSNSGRVRKFTDLIRLKPIQQQHSLLDRSSGLARLA